MLTAFGRCLIFTLIELFVEVISAPASTSFSITALECSQNWHKMDPKLEPKSMKNGFQEALNKKDEKGGEKNNAVVRGGVRARGGGVP